MRAKESEDSFTKRKEVDRELMQEFRDIPPEIMKTLIELGRTMKRGLEETRAKVQAEKVIKQYKKKAANFNLGLVPDADYAKELMEDYLATFPRTPVED